MSKLIHGRIIFINIIFLMLFCSSQKIWAQHKYEIVKDAKGRMNAPGNSLSFLKSFGVLSTAKAASLSKVLYSITSEITKLPLVKSPAGYNSKIFYTSSSIDLKEAAPAADVICYFRTLEKDWSTGEIKSSMDGADLYCKINYFDIFSQMGNYWGECGNLKLPLFFEELNLTDSTNDYIEFEYKGSPVRIVTAGKKPLLVPLSRKEYFQFLIARATAALKDHPNWDEEQKESRQFLINLLKTEAPEDTAYTARAIREMDNNNAAFHKRRKRTEDELSRCKAELNALSPEEAASPVRLNYNIIANDDICNFNQLVPVGRHEGTMLQKINPDFLSKGTTTPSAKIIVIYYAYPQVGFWTAPNEVEQAIMDVYKQLDYHQLKESMQ